MTGRKAQAAEQELRNERLQLARACQDPLFIEAYLREVEDTLRVKASESVDVWWSALDTELSVPALKTGFSVPSLSKIPRGLLLTAIRQASINATILFPNGLAASLYETPEIPQGTLARIALSPLSLWVHAALADALSGGKPDVFFGLLAQTLKNLTEPDEQSTPLSHVTMVHKATIEVVRETYESHKENGTPKPRKILGIPTFMPSKFEVKKRTVAMFGKLVPDICRKKNPETGRYESRDQIWTRIFADSGLRALIDERGRHLRKNNNATPHENRQKSQLDPAPRSAHRRPGPYPTSDHRVAGSSPAGCKVSTRAV
jgi:hypothetical protein